jgi:hypothetical protein
MAVASNKKEASTRKHILLSMILKYKLKIIDKQLCYSVKAF